MEGHNKPARIERSAETVSSKERAEFQRVLVERFFPELRPSEAVNEWTEEYPGVPSWAELFAQYETVVGGITYGDPSANDMDAIMSWLREMRPEWRQAA